MSYFWYSIHNIFMLFFNYYTQKWTFSYTCGARNMHTFSQEIQCSINLKRISFVIKNIITRNLLSCDFIKFRISPIVIFQLFDYCFFHDCRNWNTDNILCFLAVFKLGSILSIPIPTIYNGLSYNILYIYIKI